MKFLPPTARMFTGEMKKQTDQMEKRMIQLEQTVSEIYIRQYPHLTCNVCGKELTYPNFRFLPFGNPVRFTRCPYCRSLERHRLLKIYLERDTDFFNHRGLKVLHFAPEKCLYDLFIRPEYALDYYPVDINPNTPGIVQTVDMLNIPYEDDSFDVIIANHVIEHISDERKALSEVRRVLKPGGFAILTTVVYQEMETTLENPAYNTDELRLKYYGQKDHVRKYGRDYPERLKAAGFQVHCIDLLSTLDAGMIERHRLDAGRAWYGMIYRVEKEVAHGELKQ